jgi:hypothetical protein
MCRAFLDMELKVCAQLDTRGYTQLVHMYTSIGHE